MRGKKPPFCVDFLVLTAVIVDELSLCRDVEYDDPETLGSLNR